jgi:hypothetical protein
MSHGFLCGPDRTHPDEPKPGSGTESETADDSTSHRRGRAQGHVVASVQQCLAGLSSLPGLIALGYLSTAQANAIRGAFTAILTHHQKTQAPPKSAKAGIDVMQAVRDHPELAALLEPLLTDEQLDSLMEQTRDDREGGDG